jgi:cytochrome c-type biogenesis protein CcmH
LLKRTNYVPVLLLLAAAILAAATACVSENDLTAEQRAFQLERQLMCPICDGQTIDQSHSQLAQDMKMSVRQQIADGKTNQEIRDYFVTRYGEVVLAAPEASGFNLLVWVIPAVIAGGGALAVFWVLKNMRKTARATVTESPQSSARLADRQLEKYLKKVDAEIGYHSATTAAAGTDGDPGDRKE